MRPHRNRTGFRAGQVVVAIQMAMCLALLVGAGLAVRSLRNLEKRQPRVARSRPARLRHHPSAEPPPPDAEVIRFYHALTDRLRVLPGIEAATLVQVRPGAGASNNTIAFVDGVPSTRESNRQHRAGECRRSGFLSRDGDANLAGPRFYRRRFREFRQGCDSQSHIRRSLFSRAPATRSSLGDRWGTR